MPWFVIFFFLILCASRAVETACLNIFVALVFSKNLCSVCAARCFIVVPHVRESMDVVAPRCTCLRSLCALERECGDHLGQDNVCSYLAERTHSLPNCSALGPQSERLIILEGRTSLQPTLAEHGLPVVLNLRPTLEHGRLQTCGRRR